ncbi:MAG: short-chain dehydrogenase, partial [Bacteroidota bacterium]
LSKSMLFNLSEILNEEGKGKNITSTIIVPSTIDTPGTRAALPNANFEDWIKPDEIADTLEFLCTKAGRKLRHSVLKLYGNA